MDDLKKNLKPKELFQFLQKMKMLKKKKRRKKRKKMNKIITKNKDNIQE
jgi:hypothetical protein